MRREISCPTPTSNLFKIKIEKVGEGDTISGNE
jgi:hypothetical protein